MNTIHNQDKQLYRNLWILLGICLLTGILTMIGGFFSANKFILSIDKHMQEFYDGMTGGIIPLFISGTVYFSKYLFGVFLVAVPIVELILSSVLMIISLLFQIGSLKDWKIIASNVLVGLVDIVKVLFIVYLILLIYLTYKVSAMLIVIFTLQMMISLIPIVLSIKLIYIPSRQKTKEPMS